MEREHVGHDVSLGDPLPFDVREEHEPDALALGKSAKALALRAGAGNDEDEPRIVGRGDRAHKCVESFLR